MESLKVNVLIGLPGSGKTTWLKNNFKTETYFDNFNMGIDGLDDENLERLGDLMHNPNVKEISISDINFADARVMFQTLEYIHTLIESSGREDIYNFVLFPQSEAHCIRNLKERGDGNKDLPTIQRLAPVIKQTFLFVKNRFPRYTQEVHFSPIAEDKKSQSFNESVIPNRQVEMDVLSGTFEEENPIKPPKKDGFLSGLFRKS